MRIFLHGYYGNSNIGDESILESIIQQIKNRYPDSEIVVSSSDPNQTLSVHPEVDGIVRRRSFRTLHVRLPFEILTATDYWSELYQADELWIGGGGLIRDTSLYRFALLTFVAKIFGTKVRFVGPGGAKLSISLRNRFITKSLFRAADSVVVRDKITKSKLKSLGIRNYVKVVPDPALLLTIDNSLPDEWTWILDGRYAVVSVRDPSELDIDTKSMANLIDGLVNELDFHPVFLPFQSSGSSSDIEMAKKIQKYMSTDATIIEESVDFRTAFRIIEMVDFVIGVRLHSVILASRARTPFFGLAYAPKSEAFFTMIDREVIWCDDFSIQSTIETAKNDLSIKVDETNIEQYEKEASQLITYSTQESKSDRVAIFCLMFVVIFTPIFDLVIKAKNKLSNFYK